MSAIVLIFVKLIESGRRTIDDVPDNLLEDVKKVLDGKNDD